MFGWCTTNQHSECIVSYKRFWFEVRRKKSVLVYADELTLCDCTCHNPEAVKKTVRKPRRNV